MTIRAVDVGRQHIGRVITTHVRTAEGLEPVTGVLRWITWTSDQVALALEETEDAGATEWTLGLGDEVAVR